MLHTLEERRLHLNLSLEALLSGSETWGNSLHPYFYQNDAVGGIRASAQRNKTRFYVHMPTSSGKSEVIAATVWSLLEHASVDDLPRIWIVAPTQNLVVDMRDRILKYFPKIPVGLYYSEEQDLGNAVTITTGESFNSLLEMGIMTPEEVDYLFLDEAHHWLTNLKRGALNPFYKSSVIIGSTATIEFNKLRGLYRTLGEEAYSISYEELIEKGHISERANIIVGMKLSKGISLKAEQEAYSEAVRQIALHYRDSVEDDEGVLGNKTVVGHRRINDAKYTADLLNNDPEIRQRLIAVTGNPDIIPAAVIYGGQKELSQIVKDFDAGKYAYLCGARITGEGLNTKARDVITPELWSPLNVEQYGGRVRDKSGVCRVFTVVRENSGKRKSAFYAEAIGAARITRLGKQYGYARPLEQLKLSHPPIGNLNIYNTPNEVASFIKSRERKRHDRGARFIGVSEMAKALGAWRPEVEYIYSLLNAKYRASSSNEIYLPLNDINVPKEFLRPAPDGTIAIYEDADEIVQDIIGEYSEVPENVLILTDVESHVLPAQRTVKFSEIMASTNRIFSDAERAYIAILPWKYGTETEEPNTVTPPTFINSGGARVLFRHIGLYMESDKAYVGIGENALARFWAQQATPEEFTAAFGAEGNLSKLVNRFYGRRMEKFKDLYVEVSSDNYELISRHIERTGKKARAFLKGATDVPAGLTEGKLSYYLSGEAQEVRRDYQDWILARYENFPDKVYLNEKQLVGWIKDTKEKTGKYPNAKTDCVWCRDADGNFKTVDDENWESINKALKNKNRGLINQDGSSVAYSIFDLRRKHGLGEKYEFADRSLTESQVLDWIKVTKEKTGKYPGQNTEIVWCRNAGDGFEIVEGDSWYSINSALRNKNRGLVNDDGSSIATSLYELRKKHDLGGKYEFSDLNEEQVVKWIGDTKEKTTKYPTLNTETIWSRNADGSFEIVEGVTWLGINQGLKGKHRGLENEDGSSIANSLFELRKKHALGQKYEFEDRNLTEHQIIEWVIATREKTGEIPVTTTEFVWCRTPDGDFEIVEGESWKNINDAIANRLRGLVAEDGSPIASSLLALKKKHGIGRDLTEDRIVGWILATHKKIGRYPSAGRSEADNIVWTQNENGDFEVVEGETWNAIDAALSGKLRGLINKDGSPIATSLAELKRKHGLVSDRPLTRARPIGSTESRTPGQIKTLTDDEVESRVVEWMRATQQKIGKLPTTADKEVWQLNSEGIFEIVEGETWNSIDDALHSRWQNLSNNDDQELSISVTDLRKRHGLADLKRRYGLVVEKCSLTEELVVGWILATQKQTGKLPVSTDEVVWCQGPDGIFKVVEGETWIAINGAIKTGGRGLTNPDGSLIADSLADLKRKKGFVVDKGDLTEQLVLDWIIATKKKTGKYPSAHDEIVWCQRPDGSFEIVENERWPLIDQNFMRGNRGLVSQDGSQIANGLADFKGKHGLVEDTLTEELIARWMIDTTEKTGAIPTADDKIVWSKKPDGTFEVIEGENWNALQGNLYLRQRGLPKEGAIISTSLGQLKKKHDLDRKLNKLTGILDLEAEPQHLAMLHKLMEEKGNPSANRIFRELPAKTKQRDTDGLILFNSHKPIEHLIRKNPKSVPRARLAAIFVTLRKMRDGGDVVKLGQELCKRKKRRPKVGGPPVIEKDQASRHGEFLQKLWTQKGRPGSVIIFNALPPAAKTPDAQGKVLFASYSYVEGTLKNGQGSVSRPRLAVLLSTLRHMPTKDPRVDLSDDSPQWIRLKELWEQKGSPRSMNLWKSLPATARQPTNSSEALFPSFSVIDSVLMGKGGRRQKSISLPRYEMLTSTLGAREDLKPTPRVDLSPDSKNRQFLDELWDRKGKPAHTILYRALVEKKDDAGNIIYTSESVIGNILPARRQKSMPEPAFNTLVAFLETQPDAENNSDEVIHPKKPSHRLQKSKADPKDLC